MKGNLLIDINSFDWQDLSIDYSECVEKIFILINHAKEFGDKIFTPPTLWDSKFSWGDFCELMGWNELERNEKAIWLNSDTWQLIGSLSYYLCTDLGSDSLSDLNDIEFIGELNGLLGCGISNDIENNEAYIYDIPSWYNWHRMYFTNHPPTKDNFCTELAPFYPNLYLNTKTIPNGLNGLHRPYAEIMKTILHHLTALNDVYHHLFYEKPQNADDVCTEMQGFYSSHLVKIEASRNENNCEELKFDFHDILQPNITKKLDCNLHTKMKHYFESNNDGYNAKGNRIYFHQPINNFCECTPLSSEKNNEPKYKVLVARIGKHADC
jgi:hypothetical protein